MTDNVKKAVQTIINCSPEEAEVLLIAANTDISSSGRKGANNSPRAIYKMLQEQIELNDPLTGICGADRLKIGWKSLGELNGFQTGEALHMSLVSVEKAIQDAWATKKFPFLVGGDHSNTIGALRALKKTAMKKSVGRPHDVTVVVIDAHHDLRPNDADFRKEPFGAEAHCCALREAAEAGFRIMQVGVRDYSCEEAKFAKECRVKTFRWIPDSLNKLISSGRNGTPVKLVLGQIKTELVYISIDVDGFDPAVMPATGTPVSGGLSWEYGLSLVAGICTNFTLVGADICEVTTKPFKKLGDLSPADYLTARNAAQLIYNIINWGIALKM